MATWELFKISAKRAANKALKETGDAADLAALHLKLKSLEAKRDEGYEMLGRLTYRQLKTGVSQAERIAPVLENIDKVRAKIKKVSDEIERTKLAREERRAKEHEAIALELEELVDETESDESDEHDDDDEE
ncbi:MAG: hypothetical protein IJ011_02265 [Clostridia bacterium]|nr:hypothetical protein [Clostridia bacterium]